MASCPVPPREGEEAAGLWDLENFVDKVKSLLRTAEVRVPITKRKAAEPEGHSLISSNNKLLARVAKSRVPSDTGKKKKKQSKLKTNLTAIANRPPGRLKFRVRGGGKGRRGRQVLVHQLRLSLARKPAVVQGARGLLGLEPMEMRLILPAFP